MIVSCSPKVISRFKSSTELICAALPLPNMWVECVLVQTMQQQMERCKSGKLLQLLDGTGAVEPLNCWLSGFRLKTMSWWACVRVCADHVSQCIRSSDRGREGGRRCWLCNCLEYEGRSMFSWAASVQRCVCNQLSGLSNATSQKAFWIKVSERVCVDCLLYWYPIILQIPECNAATKQGIRNGRVPLDALAQKLVL